MYEQMPDRSQISRERKSLPVPVCLRNYLHEKTRIVKIDYMAVSIIFKLLVATVLTLLLVPAFYMIVKDLISLSVRLFGRA